MALLDEILAAAGSALSNQNSAGATVPHADVASAALQMLGTQSGGMAGIAQAFEQKGLGSLMSSWISTGPNLPISADQVQHGLGDDLLSQLSRKVGVSPAMAASALTVVLPMLVNKLTPQGSIPQQHSLLQDGIALLESQLRAPRG